MNTKEQLSARVNLMLPLDVSIQVEKEADKRGIGRAQFIKEAIHEKLRRLDTKETELDHNWTRNEIREIKHLLIAVLDKLSYRSDIGKETMALTQEKI